ncbi:MAG: hypothetical protein E6Q60_06295 [Nitrosomonas oligotropha]|uniref:Cadherin-like domain-containing protein n=1 Tax=Nitrosomonas oligotropha TaxID=42354 RepID=A0A5C7VWG5_9PROT|nr:MAG: hypothetical protein E6Q60_06295 [Nitrosomonas oligotropha]
MISPDPSILEVFGRTHANHWFNSELYALATPELILSSSDYPKTEVKVVKNGPNLVEFLNPDFSLLTPIGGGDTEFADALNEILSFLREAWDIIPEALSILLDSRLALPDFLPASGPLNNLLTAMDTLSSVLNLPDATGEAIADAIESIFDSRATLEGLRDTVGFSLVSVVNAIINFWELSTALYETLQAIDVATTNARIAGTKAFLSTTISIGDFLLDSIASLPENTVGSINALAGFLDSLGGVSMMTGPIVAVDNPTFRMDLYGVEDAVVLMREPGASVDLKSGKNLIMGSVRSLNDGSIREFGIDDAIFVVGEEIANDDLSRRKGSAILGYDVDGDGIEDITIALEGNFRLASFETEVVENGTYIRYLGNAVPLAENDGRNFLPEGFLTDEDSAFTTANVLANDSDGDGDVLHISALDTTDTRGLVINNDDGTFNYNPNGAFDYLNAGESATDSFVYTVSDGNGGSDTATVFIEVMGVEDGVELFGTSRSETLNGTAGDDRIKGNDGNDVLKGGAGNDWLAGERGSDILLGGLGKDIFFFSKGGGGDTISDFTNGFDKIQIAADTGITSFGQLKIAGGGGKGFVYTTFGLGNDTQVVLNGVPSTVLDATDFIFTA